MKKLILIILILILLPITVDADDSQKIIFSGSYLYNNLGTDEIAEADSAWLYMYYYDALVGSTTVTAKDLQWDGFYQHVHSCSNDSADGWSGHWVFFDSWTYAFETDTIQITEIATVATARDSTSIDSLLSMLTNVKGRVLDLVYYWGACDDCYYRLFPEGGSPNKDSAIIIDPSLGADSLVGKVIYLHGTDETVVDTAYFYRDEPW